MTIAELTILENITNTELLNMLSSGNEPLNITFKDIQGKQTTLDITPLFRNQDPWSDILKKTFDFANYQLNKDDIMFLIFKEDNNFTLKSNKIISPDTTEEVLNHQVLLKVSVNTGEIVGKIIDTKEYLIDIANPIPQEVKDKLQSLGLELIGDNWNTFTINGKAKIEFQRVADSTVFAGNKVEGFITEIKF